MHERALRILAAVALFVGGLVHLQLYFLGYRSYPDANLGRSFVLNAVLSAIVAALLAVRTEWQVRVAGILVAAGTLVAFMVTRSSDVLFGFTEKGLEPSPQALVTVVSELGAIAVLGLTFLPRLRREEREHSAWSTGPAIGAFAIAAVVMLGLGSLWASNYGRTDDGDEAVVESTVPGPVTTPQVAASSTTTDVAPSTTVSTATDPTTDSTTDSTAAGSPTVPSQSTAVPTSTIATTSPPVTNAPAPAAGAVVDIVDFTFAESAISIPIGSTVTWTNSDQFDHSVVANDDSFESDSLDGGDTFAHVFEVAGEYTYICGIHPYMEGTVTVTG